MLKNIVFILLSIIFISGCAGSPLVPPREVLIAARYDSNSAKSALAPGDSKLTGSALMRQKGGGVVTCAGEEVHIWPVTAYSSERVRALYGNNEGGYKSYYSEKVKFIPDEQEYYIDRKKTVCDAQGSFEFDKLQEGKYYVATQVRWTVGYSTEGGMLVKMVEIGKTETKKIVLTPQ